MSVNLSFIGGAGWQFFSDVGNPLSGGLLYTYEAGTTTPQATYTSRTGLTANANPIVLDSAGRTPEQVWATEGLLYKYVLKSSTGATIRTYDNIGGSVVASDLAQDLAAATGAALVGYQAPGGSARTVESKLRESVSVLDFGASPESADNSAAFALAVQNTPTNGTIEIPAGTWYGYFIIWRSDISIKGAGSAATIVKLPNNCPNITVPAEVGGTITGLPNVIEVGKCALGNAAPSYQNITLSGLTIDGNFAGNPPIPDLLTNDVFGHGTIFTNIQYYSIQDVVSQNCNLTGIDLVLNTNYGNVQARVKDCGNSLLNYPNFDMNAAKFNVCAIVSENGKYGGRMQDSSNGNIVNITIYNPQLTGYIYTNQTVNYSYANEITANVIGGCIYQGVNLGVNCFNSKFTANVRSITGDACYIGSTGALEVQPKGNLVNVTTHNCGNASLIDYGKFNDITINSQFDGVNASNIWLLQLNGTQNRYSITQQGNSTNRGVLFGTSASGNHIVDYIFSGIIQVYLDLNTTTPNSWANKTSGSIPENWITPKLGTWSQPLGSPFAAVQYYKDYNGIVHVKGRVSGGTGTIFTFPEGFQPAETLIFPTNVDSAVGVLVVNDSGAVSLGLGTGATAVDLSPISFYAY